MQFFPFDNEVDAEFEEDDDDFDGEVIDHPPQPQPQAQQQAQQQNWQQQQWQQAQPVEPRPDWRNAPDLQINNDAWDNQFAMAKYQQRGRAICMFVEIPILALVTFNDDTPGLVRAGAGLLAIWKAIELARGGAQQMKETAQQWAAEQ